VGRRSSCGVSRGSDVGPDSSAVAVCMPAARLSAVPYRRFAQLSVVPRAAPVVTAHRLQQAGVRGGIERDGSWWS
jgi:hypothetical protein